MKGGTATVPRARNQIQAFTARSWHVLSSWSSQTYRHSANLRCGVLKATVNLNHRSGWLCENLNLWIQNWLFEFEKSDMIIVFWHPLFLIWQTGAIQWSTSTLNTKVLNKTRPLKRSFRPLVPTGLCRTLRASVNLFGYKRQKSMCLQMFKCLWIFIFTTAAAPLGCDSAAVHLKALGYQLCPS